MDGYQYETLNGKRRSSELIYVHEQKQLYQKKSVYKGVIKYVCYTKNCKSRLNLEENKILIKAKNYIEHNHSENETLFNEMKAVNLIKSNCEKSSTVLSDVNALSGIRAVFQDICAK